MADKKLDVEKFLREFIKEKSFNIMGYPVEFASLKGNTEEISDRLCERVGVFLDPNKVKYGIRFTIDCSREHVMYAKVCEINDVCVSGRALPSLAINDTDEPTIKIKSAAKRVAACFLDDCSASADTISQIGDQTFPLALNIERDIDKAHEWVGHRVKVNKLSMRDTKDKVGMEGHIVGVGINPNKQPIALEVELSDGKTYVGPIKDFNFL